jgi:hypothetical protein
MAVATCMHSEKKAGYHLSFLYLTSSSLQHRLDNGKKAIFLSIIPCERCMKKDRNRTETSVNINKHGQNSFGRTQIHSFIHSHHGIATLACSAYCFIRAI